MFWDNVAGVYDVFVNVINRKTHQKLKKIVSSLIEPGDTVLNRVCKDGGMLIIPTYMNKDDKGKTNGFSDAAQKAGADFKREFSMESYRQFFLDAGYPDVEASLADGRIPCAVAVMRKASK